MGVRIPYYLFSTFLFQSGVRVPSKRILITADLDEPGFDVWTKKLMDMLSEAHIPLTLFCTNELQGGRESYAALRRIVDFAGRNNVTLEIASHSIRHESLAHTDLPHVIATIQKSITSFRRQGIPVCGFRAPYLSTEGRYRQVLKEMSTRDGIILYDSSTLFEGNLFVSRIHDFLRYKPPHDVADIWELPISCLDDYHLFTKLRRTEDFVCQYWRRKVDVSLRKYNYFLLLLHPDVIGIHLSALEALLLHCKRAHPTVSYTTCLKLVEELNVWNKRRSNCENEDLHDKPASAEETNGEVPDNA